MTTYYSSKSNKGFFISDLGNLPEDAFEISYEYYMSLLNAQGEGKVINWDVEPPVAEEPPLPSSIEAYNQAIATIQANGSSAARSVKVPYSDEEAQTWWCQFEEAEEWTKDNTYVPVMLNAMVSASNGGWNISGLVSHIIDNAYQWKNASGNILGQVKVKTSALNALKLEVDSGVKSVTDIISFDCSITTPTVNLEDKFS